MTAVQRLNNLNSMQQINVMTKQPLIEAVLQQKDHSATFYGTFLKAFKVEQDTLAKQVTLRDIAMSIESAKK